MGPGTRTAARRAVRGLLAVGAVAGIGLSPTAAPATAATKPLVAAGRTLRDAQGRTVVLHGLFAVWKQPPYVPAATDSTTNPQLPSFTSGDADIVRDLGLDAVRLAWNWQGVEPTPGVYDDAYLDGFAAVQAKLASRGVYTVLDSHQDQYNQVLGDKPGFPAWTTLTDGLPTAPEVSDPAYRLWKFPLGYTHPATGHAFANLYANAPAHGRGIRDAFAAAWRHVVRRFARLPMVAGYDLMNEPWPGVKTETGADPACASDAGCPVFDRGTLQPFETALARAIRSVDTVRTVFYEPTITFNSGHPNGFVRVPKGIAPAGLSFHNQCSTRATYSVTKDPALIAQGHVICPPQEARTMRNADAVAARLGGPPLMTEVAGTTDGDTEELNCLFERADAFQTGFTYGLSWSNPDKELRRLHDESASAGPAPFKEMVLARVYPRAIAGTPTRYRFDVCTGRFALTYTRRTGVTAPTLVSVPTTIQYPHGYVVTVKGGRVTSRAGAPMVTVVNGHHARTVRVTIAPVAGDATVRPQFAPCSLNPPS